MPIMRSWQRDITQQEYERDLAERRATCTHANDAHLRHVRSADTGALDDHATDVVHCADCSQYLFATSYRSRPDVDYTVMPIELARAEAKRERDDLRERLHRPGKIFA